MLIIRYIGGGAHECRDGELDIQLFEVISG
jgi:hypothetical protein